jgi:hypothetical protein
MTDPAPVAHPALDGTQGLVVVTRFVAPTVPRLIVLRFIHPFVKLQIRLACPGLVGAASWTSWIEKTLYSISAWESSASIYDLGNVNGHVNASRIPGHLGVTTSCGVFSFAGEWKEMLFQAGPGGVSPLTRTGATANDQ